MELGGCLMSKKIVVIGGGIAGYTFALELARSKEFDITLVEKKSLGGVCLHEGCIPTKFFLKNSKKSNLIDLQREKAKIINKLESQIKFLIGAKKINYVKDSAKIISEQEVMLENSNTILRFDFLVLAGGSQPIIPKEICPGKDFITSTQFLDLTEPPNSLVIVGGGYLGVEIATILVNLGTKVTLVEKEKSILPSINLEASHIIKLSLEKKGVQFLFEKSVTKLEDKKLFLSDGTTLKSDLILICIGRRATPINSKIPFEMEKGFIKTNFLFETSHKNIFAIGDCISGPLLAHKAMYDAKTLAKNILTGSSINRDYSKIPFVVFSDPLVAGIGVPENFKKIRISFSSLGKSYCDHSTKGFVEVGVDSFGKIMACLIVNKNALEVLGALIPLINMEVSLEDLSKMVFAHPTSAEILSELSNRANDWRK